ncbi:hypothetical protein GP2143_14521 [marine gamma proteobacterium HTCC2143]|uniref:Uncharacterized protein n=1 Tax=marine gamma proteobacterium HTCC2143 TaxID=247633 RepID=A0Y8M4_9GAMM|nr:hypothetical protein GP2143_14521 [marine gamma proteobacterium HTCC2143]
MDVLLYQNSAALKVLSDGPNVWWAKTIENERSYDFRRKNRRI